MTGLATLAVLLAAADLGRTWQLPHGVQVEVDGDHAAEIVLAAGPWRWRSGWLPPAVAWGWAELLQRGRLTVERLLHEHQRRPPPHLLGAVLAEVPGAVAVAEDWLAQHGPPRVDEVMRHLRAGLTTQETAAAVGTTATAVERTWKAHRRSLPPDERRALVEAVFSARKRRREHG